MIMISFVGKIYCLVLYYHNNKYFLFNTEQNCSDVTQYNYFVKYCLFFQLVFLNSSFTFMISYFYLIILILTLKSFLTPKRRAQFLYYYFNILMQPPSDFEVIFQLHNSRLMWTYLVIEIIILQIDFQRAWIWHKGCWIFYGYNFQYCTL